MKKTKDYQVNQISKFRQIIILITIVLITNCKNELQINDLCKKTPKYYKKFKLPENIIGYNNYEQAIDCSKKINKPLAIYFTAYNCEKCEEFETNFLSSKKASKIINDNFIFVGLFINDKTELPKEDQYFQTIPEKNRKRKIKTIGHLNCTLITKYHHSSQPTLFITNKEGEILSSINYDPDSNNLINELIKATE